MVPSSNRAIRRRHNGRRSCPASAAFVSLARPMRSAQGGRGTPARCESAVSASGRIGLERRACELRGDIAPENRGADMIERTLKIGPDLAADIGPALAEREVL